MAAVFLRTARALAADGFRTDALKLAVAAAVLSAWTAWLVLARVPVYEVSEHARLEVDRAVHPIAAPIAGRLVVNHLRLGAEVREGEVLAELDASSAELELAEERTRLTALAPEIDALAREVAAEEAALASSRSAASLSVEESAARLREAEASARLADDEAARLARLQAGGQVSEVELVRARAEAERRRAGADSARLAAARAAGEHTTDQGDRQARIERLKGELARLQGQATTAQAALDRLALAVGHRLIRSPATGTLAEAAALGTGTVVEAGARLGAVVPRGALRAVADFPPPAAVGRIHPGQAARLRLTGFTWTQYGSVPATVAQVATEARDGLVRVELTVEADPASPIPLAHGLPGSIEVEVERTSPLALLLRAAGKLVTRRSGTTGTGD